MTTKESLVANLTEKDFVKSVDIGGKGWDIYRFTLPGLGQGLMAIRIARDGCVEIGGFSRTVSGVVKVLQSSN